MYMGNLEQAPSATPVDIPVAPEQERALCKAFHWTNEQKLADIQFGGNLLLFDEKTGKPITNPPGLWPLRTLAHIDPWSKQRVETGPFTFCFINDPVPAQWVNHPVGKKLLTRLFKQQIEEPLALFSFDIFAQDEPQVTAFEHGAIYLADGKRFETGDAAAVANYIRSLVPYDYYEKQLINRYELPELLLPNHIALERLKREEIPELVKVLVESDIDNDS